MPSWANCIIPAPITRKFMHSLFHPTKPTTPLPFPSLAFPSLPFPSSVFPFTAPPPHTTTHTHTCVSIQTPLQCPGRAGAPCAVGHRHERLGVHRRCLTPARPPVKRPATPPSPAPQPRSPHAPPKQPGPQRQQQQQQSQRERCCTPQQRPRIQQRGYSNSSTNSSTERGRQGAA